MNAIIEVTMKDFWTNESVVRNIDISNFCVNDDAAPLNWERQTITTDENKQRELLNQWIDTRANEQHETSLVLIDWAIAR